MSDPSAAHGLPRLLPWPAHIELRAGRLALEGGFTVGVTPADPMIARAATRALGSDSGGVPVAIRAGDATNDESYRLEVAVTGVAIDAPGPAGVVRALATLLQLADQLAGDGTAPCCVVRDAPRYPWRGLMLDVARHFIGIDALERTLDAMALVKLNVLHLHLTDDQAFRFGSRRYPLLASKEHYSQDQLRGLVEYAGARAIRIVPELDMPGHATSWLAAYPQWGCEPVEPTTRFGVHDACLDPSNEAVYEAIDGLLAECAATFPDPCLHVGGDEVNGRWWSTHSGVAALMARERLADVAAVQAYFLERVAKLAARHGRRVVVWDEALAGGAPRGVVVQAWRGATARDRALAAGHDCIVSDAYYLDLGYPADLHHAADPGATAEQRIATEDRLFDDPRLAHIAAGMRWTLRWRDSTARARSGPPGQVLGGEACLWAEMVDERLLDVRLWSRLPAVADRLWAPAEVSDAGSLYTRMTHVEDVLARHAGVDVAKASDRLLIEAGVWPTQLPVVRLLEPLKWYARLLGAAALEARLAGREMPQARPYRTGTPLDRPVDGLRSESVAAREFAALLGQPGLGEHVAQLRAIVAAGGFLDELVAPCEAIDRILAAVQAVLGGSPAGSVRAEIESAATPRGEYLVAIAPAVLRWLSEGATP